MEIKKFNTATEALKSFREESGSCFHKLHFWESMRDLEKRLRGQIRFRFDLEDFDWCTVVICGSRARGVEYPGSDLNAFFFYRGEVSEQDVIDRLEDRPLYHDKASVKVKPVRVWGVGQQIIDTLEKEMSYLDKKELAVQAEKDLHAYYEGALQRLLSRPRNKLAMQIFLDIQDGNSYWIGRAVRHAYSNVGILEHLAGGRDTRLELGTGDAA